MRYVALGISHDLFPVTCKIEKQTLQDGKSFFDGVVISNMALEDRAFLEDLNVDTGIDVPIPPIVNGFTLEPGDELLVITRESVGVYKYTVYTVGSI